MAKTDFYVNTALVCYKCSRTAVVRLKQSWRTLAPADGEKEVLDVVFVSCVCCLTLLHVHDPTTTIIRKYVNLNLKKYSDLLEIFEDIFECKPSIFKERKFSITEFKMKEVVLIRDANDIFYMPAVPDANIKILEGGREKVIDSRFFKHDPLFTTRHHLLLGKESEELNGDVMPFASVANWPPVVPTALDSYLTIPPYSGSSLKLLIENEGKRKQGIEAKYKGCQREEIRILVFYSILPLGQSS